MKREGLEFVPAVEAIAERFGVRLMYDVPLPAAAGPGFVPSSASSGANTGEPALTPEQLEERKYIEKAAKRLRKLDETRKAEQRIEENRLRALGSSIKPRKIQPMSAPVAERWDCPLHTLEVTALAEARGWPVAWAWWLAQEKLISFPALPWGTDRGIAFRVDLPEFTPVKNHMELTDLIPVGYHQRFTMQGRKSWVYVPYLPAPEKVSTEFQRAMVAAELERGGVVGESVVPGLPFFIGCLRGVRFLVIAEGQWDAVTFAGAAGWLDGETSWPQGAAVMGVRGSNGVDTMLAYWNEWLGAEAPAVLVLADNDAAGRKWSEYEAVPLGQAPAPTFTEKLLHAGVRRVQVHRVRPDLGKDFNDYYKVRKPGPGAIAAWLRSMGFVGASGEFL
jgi:hypothetical protein